MTKKTKFLMSFFMPLVIFFVFSLLAEPAYGTGGMTQVYQQLHQTQANTDINRSQFKHLLREHAVGGAERFKARFDQSSYYPELKRATDLNTEQVSNAVGNLYGNNKTEQFRNLWAGHIDDLELYADSLRSNNIPEQQNISQRLNIASDQMSDFLAQNNMITRDQIRSAVGTHIEQEKSVIRTHANRDESGTQNLINQASEHANVMADLIWNNSNQYSTSQQDKGVSSSPGNSKSNYYQSTRSSLEDTRTIYLLPKESFTVSEQRTSSTDQTSDNYCYNYEAQGSDQNIELDYGSDNQAGGMITRLRIPTFYED